MKKGSDLNDGLDQITTIEDADSLDTWVKEASNLPPSVVLLIGPAVDVGRQWLITKTMIIGRNRDADICINDRSVSNRHAELQQKRGQLQIADLNSTNGTRVDGVKVSPNEPHKLSDNNQIKVGKIILKFQAQGNIETSKNQLTFNRAQLDPLTNIFNKGAFLNQGREIFDQASITGTPLTLIVFDLDDFKLVNDAYGHACGDYVLTEIVNIISNRLIRQSDFFARFGGEEFCIILLDTNRDKGVEAAERILTTIANHDFEYNNFNFQVTLSLGVAELNKNTRNFDELFESADQATYKSKQSGKNKVTAN